jgi:hypothetical protein
MSQQIFIDYAITWFQQHRGERQVQMTEISHPNNEIQAITQLVTFTATQKNPSGTACTLRFNFHPNSVGPYGVEGSQWQAESRRTNMATVDYGTTIEQAAERLLDRLLHPESYEDEGD